MLQEHLEILKALDGLEKAAKKAKKAFVIDSGRSRLAFLAMDFKA
jgi:hypothetical protein